ncbi:MAG TPA: sugar ABC transporter permease [Thermomicrobiales bacterium]|nr:sugar ABC transporter permease [Thermomicrobiales bacterium]
MSADITGNQGAASDFSLQQHSLPAAVRRREAVVAYALLSPAIILFLVFVAGPLIGAIVLSFFEWDLLSDAEFVGFANYRQLFTDSAALAAIRNTFIFAFWSLTTHITLALGLALMVQRSIPGILKYAFRTAIFFPVVMSWASVSLIWLFMLDPNFGFINYYLELLGLPTKSWLLMPDTAMPAIIIVDWWKSIGFTFILILAGLQGVPEHLHEAAKLDGAGAWRRFVDVTLPMLSPTLFLTSILTFIGAFQIFEPMYIMTKGGPLDRTVSIVMEIYETGFRRFEMGYASAMAIGVFVVILVVTLLQMWVGKYWVFYE